MLMCGCMWAFASMGSKSTRMSCSSSSLLLLLGYNEGTLLQLPLLKPNLVWCACGLVTKEDVAAGEQTVVDVEGDEGEAEAEDVSQ